MKTLVKNIIVFLLSCLAISVHGQYKKLIKNEKNPFDTAVAVQIKEYRNIREKLEVCDYLNQAHSTTIKTLRNSAAVKDSIILLNIREVDIYRAATLRKDSINTLLREENKNLYHKISIKSKWYTQPYFWGVVGLVAGILIVR